MNDEERAAETGRLLRQKRLEQFGPGLDIIEELRTRVGDRMAAAMLYESERAAGMCAAYDLVFDDLDDLAAHPAEAEEKP